VFWIIIEAQHETQDQLAKERRANEIGFYIIGPVRIFKPDVEKLYACVHVVLD
jgi:hypothetical protein